MKKNGKMKNTGILVFLLTLTSFVNAQITVTGKVIDNTNEPIEFANVILLDKEYSNIIIGTITDKNGTFAMTTDQKGKFNLQISFVGFEDYKTNINKSIDLGTVTLKSSNELDEVVITARKNIIERKTDKLIFNVESSPVKSGFDGVEVLKRVPSIFIDGKDNILIQNKAATVLINGRKLNLSGDELANYLKSIDASNIKGIEVQTNASSEMDANVQGGVVNFILKKKRTGLFAQVKVYQTQKRRHPNFYSSGNINYGTEKWNIYSTLSFNDAEDSGDVISSTIYNNINRQLQEKGNFLDNSKRYTFTIGTTYQPSKKHELGLELYTTTKDKVSRGSSEIDIYENNVLLDKGITTTPKNRNTKYINTSINYSVKIDTLGGKLSFIGDYATQSFENAFDATTTYEQNYYYDILERSKTNASTDIMSAQVDFNKTINKIGDLSSGIKITTTNRDNKTIGEHFVNGDYQIADDRTNAYDFTENIYAAYLSVSRKIFNDINLKLGLRVENTTIEGINLLNNVAVSQNYKDYFPSIFISKEFKNKQFISFSYNRRIGRPAFNILNPYVIKINDFSYQIGNPNLKPQYINNFNVAYNLKKHSFSIFYNQTSNLTTGIYFPVDDAIYYQAQNIGKGKVIGFDYSFGKNIKKWWYLKLGSTLQNQNYILSDQNNRYNTVSFYMNNDWNISKTWSVNLSAYYTSPRIYGYLEVADYFSSNFMFQKTFLQKKLKVRIYVDDIFNTVRDKNSGLYDDFTYNFYQKRNTQSFTLYALFTIDTNDKVRKKKNKTSNNVKNRL